MDIAELRRVARQAAGERSGRIYWFDMTLSAAVGWLAFAAAASSLHLAWRGGAVVVAALAFYRAAYFVHEIAHFRRGILPGFTLVWHLLVGIPAGVPALMAEMHKDHHRNATYGTSRDPEYAPVAGWSRWQILGSVLLMVVLPPLLVVRWGFVTPLSFMHPTLRRLSIRYLSTLAINPSYERPQPGAGRARWLAQELGCMVVIWVVAAMVVAGALSMTTVVTWWLVLALTLCLNQVKTLVTHAFELDGEGASSMDQLRDSITVGGSWVTELIAPLGNRFHAIHHMLPDAPYHDLPAIHRRLMAVRHDVYVSTCRRGAVHALTRLWTRAG